MIANKKKQKKKKIKYETGTDRGVDFQPGSDQSLCRNKLTGGSPSDFYTTTLVFVLYGFVCVCVCV